MSRKRVDYAQRFTSIKAYVSFEYKKTFLNSKKLTRKQKLKITRYYNEIAALKNRPNYEYSPKSKAKLEAAQKFAQHVKKLPELKTAFIPVIGKPKISFTKTGEIKVKLNNVEIESIKFDMKKLIKDPEGHALEKIRKSRAKIYTIQAGRYEIPNGYTKDTIIEEIVRKTKDSRYQKLDRKKQKNNHYFGNWLFGINAIHTKRQASAKTYIIAHNKAKADQKAQRKRNKKKRG